MKCAVVGSGAAAAGVVVALDAWAPDADITVFDIGHRLEDPPRALAEEPMDGGFYQQVYAQLRDAHGYSFPPPKSHFGQTLSKLPVAQRPRLWKSANWGGLTVVWGGGMFPFTDREFAGWPTSAEQMDPYYRLIADRVGVCGRHDELNEYFEHDYVNRPPLRTSSVMVRLAEAVNRTRALPDDPWDVIAGSTRLALETRSGHPRECVYSGECMLGCPRNSVWSAAVELDRLEQTGRIRSVKGKVMGWDRRRLRVRMGDVVDTTEPFDRIYIAAGCIGTTEIVMRSLDIQEGPRMQDNAVFSFPILFAGKGANESDEYFSLCNLSMGAIPRDADEEFAQFSVYPFFDHLWRYYVPRPLWPVGRPIARQARWRLLLGRVFLAGTANREFAFSLRNGAFEVHACGEPRHDETIDAVMGALRRKLSGSRFFVPPVRPPSHGTSSHYACTFPYGSGLTQVGVDGRIAPGIHLADASVFPSLPSISPTFTIMANAARTAHASLQEDSR